MKNIILLILILPTLAWGNSNDTQYYKDLFKQEETHAKYWQNGFLGLFAAGMALNLGIYIGSDDKDKEFDAAVDFVKSGLGFGDLLLNPIQANRAYDDFIQDESIENGRRIFNSVSKREAYEQSWVNHLLAGLVNGLGGAAIAFIDDREKDGLINFLIGMTVSEIKIFTAPKKILNAKSSDKVGINLYPIYGGLKVTFSY